MQLIDFKRFLSLAWAFLLAATPIFAEDSAPVPASLSFQYSGMKWTRTTTKFSGAVDSERKATSLLSGDLADSMLWATINGKLNIYFYPFQDLNAQVSVGYMLMDTWEVGIDVGLNSTHVDNPKSKVSSDLMGGYTTWIVPLQKWSLENIFVLDFSSAKSTEIDSTTNSEDTKKTTGTYMKVSSTIVIPIAKNAYYLSGVWIYTDRTKNHTLEVNKSVNQLGIMLAGLRITVE